MSAMPANDVVAATRDYERWLSTQTSVVAADLRRKRERMDEDPFVFLRATYYWLGDSMGTEVAARARLGADRASRWATFTWRTSAPGAMPKAA